MSHVVKIDFLIFPKGTAMRYLTDCLDMKNKTQKISGTSIYICT